MGTLLTIGIVILLALCGAILLGKWLKRYLSPQIMGRVVRCVRTDEKVMALTFDDGPNPENTPHLLDVLDRYDARATFFVLGRKATQHPNLIAEMAGRGHEIGNHSWDHSRLVLKSYAFVKRQIESADEAIRKAGYKGNILVRSPYGEKLFVLPYYLWKHDRIHALWNVDTVDWAERSPEHMLESLEGLSLAGAILLLHDGHFEDDRTRENTIRFVERLLETYIPLGYRFVTVSDLLALETT